MKSRSHSTDRRASIFRVLLLDEAFPRVGMSRCQLVVIQKLLFYDVRALRVRYVTHSTEAARTGGENWFSPPVRATAYRRPAAVLRFHSALQSVASAAGECLSFPMLYDSRHRSRLVVGQQLLLHHDRAFCICETCGAKTVDFLLLCFLLPLRGSHPGRDLLLLDKNRFGRDSRQKPRRPVRARHL